MRFEIKSTYHPAAVLGEPSFFIDNYIIDVIVHSLDESPTDVLAARIAVDHIDSIRVENSGQSLYQVCDCDSAGWESVYSKIFDSTSDDSRLRDDFFDCENDCLWHLIFIHRAVFHPKVRPLQSYILDHVAQFFPNQSAILMWDGDSGLTDEELGDLGFRRIAGEGLLLRPNPFKTGYDSSSDDGLADAFEFEDDEYVEKCWSERDC